MSKLAQEISNCRRCDHQGISVRHSSLMNRGAGGDVMIIGVEPGNTELQTGEAFSGAAGRRLVQWLVRAGVGKDRAEVFQRSYLTSLCKCNIQDKSNLPRAAANCAPFLVAQVQILTPKVCVTLGLDPLHMIVGQQVTLEKYVGRVWAESDFGKLFPLLPAECSIIPFPHPSPRSLWLNVPAHQQLLEQALGCLNSMMRKE